MGATVSTTMKIFIVACLLTISFLSNGWGKHYLVQTGDAKEDGNDDDEQGTYLVDKNLDEFDLDINTIDAEKLIYTVLNDKGLDKFEKYPEKTQEQIMAEVDKFIEVAKNGKEDADYNYGIIRNIKKLTGGGEEVLNALNFFLRW